MKTKIGFLGNAAEKSGGEPEGAKSVNIERIKNGFILRTCGMDGEEVEHVKKLSKVPSIAARLMGIEGKKSARQIQEMLREEPVEEDSDE